MSLPKTSKENKSILVLALVSAAASVLFSFVGAPFMRALFVSAKSKIFWTTAILLVAGMFVVGSTNYKILETAVYVGAIWMTLGAYSELEARGINWRSASVISLISGLLFTLAGYFLILKNLTTTDFLNETLEPVRLEMNKIFPKNNLEPGALVKYMPGVILATLFGSLALSFAFEAKIAKMFNIQRERVASGLRWLEFRLPDSIVWLTLTALLFLGLGFDNVFVKTVSINFLIVVAVAFFFQGFAVVEFMIRFYRLGLFTRSVTYLLIILQITLTVFIGFVDYWADFRRRVRRKIKTT